MTQSYAAFVATRSAAIAKAELRAARIDEREETLSERAVCSWAQRRQRSLEDAADSDARLWDPRLAALQAALARGDHDRSAVLRELVAFDRAADAESAFESLDGFRQACEAGPLVLGGPASAAGDIAPPGLGKALGRECLPPLSQADAALVALQVSDPTKRWTHPHAGAHLAMRRLGGFYTHHGIYLGNGAVIHFNGESPRQVGARVVMSSLEEFIGDNDPDGLQLVKPETFGGRPLAGLDPAVGCLRALNDVGAEGYKLVRHNCEHFASWAQLGARLSAQTRKWQRLGPVTSGNELALRLLRKELVLGRGPAPVGLLEQSSADEPLLDLGRIYRARDRDDLITWLPIWNDQGRPAAGSHRPWTADGLGAGAVWHEMAPTVELDVSWHASLVRLPGGDLYWVTKDQRWFQEKASLAELAEGRLQCANVVLSELMAPPSRMAQFAVDVVERVT